MPEDSLRCSIDELLTIFRDSLISLIPMAEKLLLEWHGRQHRDWEYVAEALFDACVRGPINSDAARRVREFNLPRYDIDIESYTKCSWIQALHRDLPGPAAMIRIVTERDPFDAVQIVKLDPAKLIPTEKILIPYRELRFALIRRSPDVSDARILEIEAID